MGKNLTDWKFVVATAIVAAATVALMNRNKETKKLISG